MFLGQLDVRSISRTVPEIPGWLASMVDTSPGQLYVKNGVSYHFAKSLWIPSMYM